MEKLIVRYREVYGRPTFYPVNEAAETFAKIENTKTITPRCMKLAESLGYVIECADNSEALFHALARPEFASL